MKKPIEIEFTFLEALEELAHGLNDNQLLKVAPSFDNVISAILHTTTQALKQQHKTKTEVKTFITLNDSGKAVIGVIEKESKPTLYKN